MKNFEIVGIGNAIVDVIAEVEEALLARLDLAKGSMTLIESQRGVRIYEQMGPGLGIIGWLGGQYDGRICLPRRQACLYRQGQSR